MSRMAILASCIGLAVAASPATAGGDVELPFSFTAAGGLIPSISGDTAGISVFPLVMDGSPGLPYPLPSITSLELVLTDLTHTNPDDLDIYLIDPLGETLEIMTDKGDGIAVVGLDLIFNDTGIPLPADGAQLVPGTFRPEDSDGTGGFSKYMGNSGGFDAWILLVIDDSPSDQGSLGSFTLRGTFVPEPASLALLGLGALAAVLRSRRMA